MSQSGLSAPASPDPDVMSGTSSRPESRSSISSSSMVDQAAESSRFSSNLDEIEKKSESGEVIGLDENAQSGGLLDDHKKEIMLNNLEKERDGEDSLEMVSDDDMEANESCKDHPDQKSPINLDPLKDTELDFEGDVVDEDSKKVVDECKKSDEEDEDGECGEAVARTSKESDEGEKEEGEELEEGEVSSEEDVGKHARMEPRPVCRFYSKGNCTWGSNCRFVHPGVLDKGNYNMFAPARPGATHPSGLPYERGYDRPQPASAGLPPPAAEWVNAPPRNAPSRSAAARHSQPTESHSETVSGAESAWERGLRQAKEMLKKSSQRKETDIDFEEKKLNLGLGEEDLDKENDYYTRPASPIQHGDVPPPFEEIEPEPYSKYPQPSGEGRWQPPPSRYPPPPYPSHHPPQGYPPYPYPESRRGFPEPGLRDREYYKSEGYDRPYYGYKPSDRDAYASSKPPLPPPSSEKRWQEERYVEVVQAPAQRSRSDEWWDPWMRPRSPGGAAAASATAAGNSSTGKSAGGGGGGGSGRRRSYSSGSSYSSSSSTSSSSSSSYSSSSRSSSRSSASSRSSSRSKSPMTSSKRRSARKPRLSEKPSKSSKTQSVPVPKHKIPSSSTTALPSTSPPKAMTVKKPSQALEKQRNALDKSPNRNREGWSSSSSRSRSRSPSVKNRPPPKSSSSLPVKTQGRSRSSSGSSSSSDDWDSSSRSSGEGRSRRANRGRRDFAERKELRGGNTPPPPPQPTTKGKMGEPPKVVESKHQIKLTLKSAAPNLKKVPNKFNDDSDEEDGVSREWEKEKAMPVSSPPAASSIAQPSRKRSAESPPLTLPPSKIAAATTPKGDKGSKKSTATRREELLKQLKAVEEAIARKRSKLTT